MNCNLGKTVVTSVSQIRPAEHALENSDNKFARRVIVVEQNDLVELRPLRFRLKLDLGFGERIRHRISELSIESNARDSRC
jgi:hypothetical protein